MSNEFEYDVLYLGSGHGTFNGAIPLASKGFKIGVIEDGLIGGTCPNRGCNAKILLDMITTTQHDVKELQGSGLAGIPEINWKDNVEHKDEVIQPLPEAIGNMMTNAGIDLIYGKGKLVDDHSIKVGNKEYSADKIVIATGAHYRKLDISGNELTHDGTDFLSLKNQPERMTVIGSGYIALEFANIAAASGTKVTVLMHHDVALRKFYRPFVKVVLNKLAELDVKFVTNVNPQSIEKIDDDLIVKTNQGDFKADWVLNATGRPANVEGIGLDEVGVKYNHQGIEVNDHLQTNIPSIYAAGDVLDKKVGKLTPTAIFESEYLTDLFSGVTDKSIDYPAVPSAVFTTPRIAQVGISVDEDETNSNKYTIKDVDLATDWFRMTKNENEGTSKLIYDNHGVLVGATEVSDQAEDSISTILPAIEYQLTPKQIKHMISLFPTIGSESWSKL